MKKYLLIIALGLASAALHAQNVTLLQDPVSSKNFNPEKYTGIRGTPFLMDKWIKGNVFTPKGMYKDLELKFNVYDNNLFFNRNDESFELVDDIVSFVLMPKPDDASSYLQYKKGISGADLRGNEFVQVLLEGGKKGLYKLEGKKLSEMSEINAGIVKTFMNNPKYYIGTPGNLVFLKLNKNEILEILKDQSDKIQAYINEKKYSFRKESEVVDVLKYYNSL